MTSGESTGRKPIQWIGLLVGLAAAIALYVAQRYGYLIDPDQPLLNSMAAVAVLMAAWWITEAVPIAATALLPLVLYPLLKIPPGNEIARAYGHPLIFLFLGGFLIALAIEDSGLHRRVALRIIAAVGDNPRRVVLGFMLATAGLSMWLSNTATTMMLLPIAASVLGQVDHNSGDPARRRNFGVALMLGLAYAASIGGVATLVGTPPNILFKAFYEDQYLLRPPISFVGWMVVALPFSIAMLFSAWALLTCLIFRVGSEPFLGGPEMIREQLRALGRMKPAERRMLLIFLTTAVLWIFREPFEGWGWSPWLGIDVLADGTRLVDDGTVAMLMALICFMLPSGEPGGGALLRWQSTVRLPWGILFLFGGGLALAQGMETTGLDKFLGERLAGGLRGLPELAMMAVVAGGMTFLTEITSNLASLNMLLPVLAGTAEQLKVNPLLLMIPATMSASCAFMLPVATAPNAIVYGSGRLRMADMIKAGIGLNLIGVAMVVGFVWLLGVDH